MHEFIHTSFSNLAFIVSIWSVSMQPRRMNSISMNSPIVSVVEVLSYNRQQSYNHTYSTTKHSNGIGEPYKSVSCTVLTKPIKRVFSRPMGKDLASEGELVQSYFFV